MYAAPPAGQVLIRSHLTTSTERLRTMQRTRSGTQVCPLEAEWNQAEPPEVPLRHTAPSYLGSLGTCAIASRDTTTRASQSSETSPSFATVKLSLEDKDSEDHPRQPCREPRCPECPVFSACCGSHSFLSCQDKLADCLERRSDCRLWEGRLERRT